MLFYVNSLGIGKGNTILLCRFYSLQIMKNDRTIFELKQIHFKIKIIKWAMQISVYQCTYSQKEKSKNSF